MKLDLQADLETKAPLDLLVLSDPSALLVHPVNPDLKAHLVKKDPPVLEAALETKAPLALLDLLDLLDLLVYLYVDKLKFCFKHPNIIYIFRNIV